MRKITKTIVENFLSRKEKKVGNTWTDGNQIQLHNNTIIERNGRTYLITLAGWSTMTTRERINGFLESIYSNWRVCQQNHKQYTFNVRTHEKKEIDSDIWYRVGLDSDQFVELGTENDDDGKQYEIVRFYHPSLNRSSRRTGINRLTIGQAKKHCSDPKTRKDNQYFDGYQEM